jgi:serine phosphatase RsbU (regulator of sigma subunit)
MNLTKIGKYLLVINAIIFVASLCGMFFLESDDSSGNLQQLIMMITTLVSYILFSVSFALLFYNAVISKRRKAAQVITIVSGIVFSIGWLFKFMHWPGASILVVVSTFLFSFGGLPLIIKSRYEKRKTLISEKTLVLSIADMISIVMITNGLLFKILHWPGSIFLIVFGGIILVITFFFWSISFRKEVKLRFLAEEKLKEMLKEIEEKHLVIEEKNREITDSITYAKRIQEAILPPLDFIQENLPDSCVYYRPKDIVAGDFYWAEKSGDLFLIAAADCTGHGVPGAMVSVVCSNALNRSVKEFGLSDPGKILDKTREIVLENFSKSKEAIKDGMDISLISVEKTSGGYTVKWAGANNPLWYISATGRAGSMPEDPVLNELKADKQPIGLCDEPKPFTTHTLHLHKGDTLYLFTDGYADQFGGPKGKKFKYKQFEELLLATKQLPLSEQFKSVALTLQAWKGSLEQIDDVCVIGIRL